MEDADLVRACLSGSDDAWGQLVERYAAFVLAVVRRTLRHHGVEPDALDDENIVAETFSALAADGARLLARYDPTYTVATYLRVIARSRTISSLRRKRADSVPLDDAARVRSSDDTPEELAMLEERRRIVGEAVDRLPPRERIIVRLYHLEEMSYAEIAQVLEISINSVGPALSRATSKLREILEHSQA